MGHHEKIWGCSRPGGNIGLFKRGSSGKNGDISLPEYRIESHNFRLCIIRGLAEGGRILGGSHNSAEMGTGAQLDTSRRTHKGISEVVWSMESWEIWAAW